MFEFLVSPALVLNVCVFPSVSLPRFCWMAYPFPCPVGPSQD